MDDEDAGWRRVLDLGRARPDQRVDDRLQGAAPVGVGEHDRSEPGAVERAVRRQHLGPELGDDGVETRRTGLDDLAGQHVGVDDDRAELAQDRGHRALPGRDPTGQTHVHGVNPTRLFHLIGKDAGV